MECAIKGLTINYKVIGEGRPLLILHGWGSNSEKWQKVANLLTENGIKVIIPDLPGFGESQKPTRAWGLADYCEFVQKFVESLNLEKFYLLGHSFGGAIAVKYSLKFPKKIEKLFLVGAACFRRKTLRKKLFYLISKILKIFSFLPFYSFLRKGFYRFVVRKSDYPYSEGIMKEIYLKIIKEDLSDVLAKVEVPTIIIWGEKDKVKTLEEGRLINREIENSKLEVIPGANHELHRKVPEKLSEVILKFL